jgi:hypothetical protein
MAVPMLRTLYNFTGGADGGLPEAGLIADGAGNLFGTTIDGGVGDYGTVFQLSGADHQTFTTLYRFTGGVDGRYPNGALIADGAGNLFGTTTGGGVGEYGTVFQLSGANHQTLTTLYRFTGGVDGRHPNAALIADGAGNLFGTTFYGGDDGVGVVFELSGADHQTFTRLYSFTGGADGGYPQTGLIADAAGNLFGTTSYFGGDDDLGVVFELSGADHHTFTRLHSFTEGADGGANRAKLIADAAGNLFGTTYGGGNGASSTIYEITNSGYVTLNRAHIAADFSASGTAGLLWQHSDGLLYEWQMNGTTIAAQGDVTTLDPAAWKLSSAADFSGDRMADTLWQSPTTGEIWLWQMNGTALATARFVGSPDPAQWKLLTSGDFNADGKADVMFQQAGTGLLYEWQMNGAAIAAQGAVTTLDPALWKLIGTADFNGDGKADLLWQSTTTGEIWEWQMNGMAIASAAQLGTPDPAQWKLLATGDFSGDGRADLLFQQAGTGLLYEWQMNGNTIAAQGAIDTLDPTQWTFLKAGDFNGDGKADLMWQQVGTGDVWEWEMNGTTIVAASHVGGADPSAWKLLA